MKKIFLFIALLISLFSYSQFPATQSMGSSKTEVFSRGAFGSDSGYIFRHNYPDTITANLGFLKNEPNIQVVINDEIWKRNNAATRWVNQSANIYNSDGTLTGNRVLTGSTFDLSITVDSFFISADTINFKNDLYIFTDGSSRMSLHSDRILSLAGEEVHINPKFDFSSGNFRFMDAGGRVHMHVYSSGAVPVGMVGEDEFNFFIQDVNVGSPDYAMSVFGRGRTNFLSLFEDSVLLGNLDRNGSARMKYVVYDTISHKLAFFDGGSGGGGGSGTVTDFIFTDANGFDGTVSTSTSTPTLSLTTTVANTRVVYSNSGALVGDADMTFNGTALKVGGTGDDAIYVSVSNAGRGGFYARNSDATGNATFYFENNVGGSDFGFVEYGGIGTGGNSVGTSFFGTSRASRTFLIHDGGAGLMVGTLNASNFTLGTNNVERIRINYSGETLVSGELIGGQKFSLSADASPAQITADQNNYNPSSTSSVFRLSTDATRLITGWVAGTDGQIIIIFDVGSFNIQFVDESASSTAANRFALNTNITIAPDQSAIFMYDATSARWRCISELK